jgi:hypothetical protein
MSGTFMLNEDVDIDKVKVTYGKICDFVRTAVDQEPGESYKAFDHIIDNLGDITKMDEKFIDEHAGDFGHELREVGVKGLTERYAGRYCIHVYGGIPFWLIQTIESLVHAHYLQCKCKPKCTW